MGLFPTPQTIMEAYGDERKLKDVHDIAKLIEIRSALYSLPVRTISHNRPTNSIYYQAIVVYG